MTNKNSRRCAVLAAIAIGLVLAWPVLAQSSDPIDDSFDGNFGNWTPRYHEVNGVSTTNTRLVIMNYKDFLNFPWGHTEAYGVLNAFKDDPSARVPTDQVEVQNTVYLQPGQYAFKIRGGADRITQMHLKVYGASLGSSDGGEVFGDNTFLSDAFTEQTSNTFTVLYPGSVTLVLYSGDTFYLDDAHLYSVAGPYPTATLAPDETPTPHATALPVDQQATPQPTPTAYCVLAPIPGTPTTEPFGGGEATPTPDPADWGVVDKFSSNALDGWQTAGSGIHVDTNMAGADGMAGALALPYSPLHSSSGTLEHALILQRSISVPVYVDGYAQADVVPIGQSAEVVVYLFDATSTWVQAGTAILSAQNWYAFHITVSGGGSAPYSAIAVTLERSDNPDLNDGLGYLDNLYIYGSLAEVPYCGGTYPPGVTQLNPAVPGIPGEGSTGVDYPLNKPCPPAVMNVPNNFWGPFFEWANLEFLRITALFPYHVDQSFFSAIQTVADSPLWVYVSVVNMLFDLRPILILAGLVITLEVVRLLYSIWRIILKIIPMAG